VVPVQVALGAEVMERVMVLKVVMVFQGEVGAQELLRVEMAAQV
jgi:hypothetical protein